MKLKPPYLALSLFLLLAQSLWLRADEAASANAPEVTAKSDIEAISIQIRTFEILNGRLPTETEGIPALVIQPEAKLPNWKQLLQAVPKDPWGGAYVYRIDKHSRHGFVVYSLGPDSKSDRDDVWVGGK